MLLSLLLRAPNFFVLVNNDIFLELFSHDNYATLNGNYYEIPQNIILEIKKSFDI